MQTNVDQTIAMNGESKDAVGVCNNALAHQCKGGNVLNLSCPGKHNILYNAGLGEEFTPIHNVHHTNASNKLSCKKHEDVRYWQTDQGGKLFVPNCKLKPGCDCQNGEV